MAINFPNSPSVGNTYDYGGVRYTYQASGYWAVTTPGTVGIASGAEVIAGIDDAKYVTPKAMEDSDFWSARNQGAGSGLDADTLDGIESTSFSLVSSFEGFGTNGRHTSFEGDVNTVIHNSIYNVALANTTNLPSGIGGWAFLHTMMHIANPTWGTQMCYSMASGNGEVYMRLLESNVWSPWVSVGQTTKAEVDLLNVDADTLDTHHASAFPLREVPGDFWSNDTSYLEILPDGAWIGSNGDFKAGIGWNGYRNHSNGYTYSGLNSNITTAALLEFDDTTLRWRGGVAIGTTLPALLDINPNEIYISGNKVWHQGNDGAGSGLDADTIDGVGSGSFVRSDQYDDQSGGMRINRNPGSTPAYGDGHLELKASDGGVSDVSLGFHRNGFTACQLRHEGNGLVLSGSTRSSAANLVVTGDIYASTGDLVWDQGNCPKSLAQNGYQKLASGLIIQWGELPSTSVLNNTVTFPIAFPTACQSVVTNHKVLTNGSDYVSQAESFTTTSFNLKNQAATSSYSWMAIGY